MRSCTNYPSQVADSNLLHLKQYEAAFGQLNNPCQWRMMAWWSKAYMKKAVWKAWTWLGRGLGRGGIWSGKVCYRLFRRPNRMCVWSWHNAANVKCFLRGTVIAGGLYYSCARLTQKYRTFFLIAFSFLHRAGTITNSLERWWIGQRLVQWPLGGGSID